MNKKGGTGIVTFLILLIMGILVYTVLSDYISTQANVAMDSIDLSGTERFFLSNIHVFIISGFIIVTLGFGAFFFLTRGGST